MFHSIKSLIRFNLCNKLSKSITKMKEKKEPHEGERLVLLIRRSSMKSQDVAKAIGIEPESLSRMKKFPKLSDGIKLKICQLFLSPTYVSKRTI